QVGFALYGVVQAQPRELAVAGVGVVQIDVLRRGGDHGVARDGGLAGHAGGQQEQGRIAHKVLDIVDTELGLHGDVRRAQVVVGVQDVGKAHNGGDVLRHARKLVQHFALRLGQGGLPGGGGS